ncbi:MAG: DUF4261 domain-containing protein [Planctomycetes bacterium]|nr:DUF4261 domain-containing protein [Planctomycetota bacterium]
MPIKGRYTAGACVLFERQVSLDALVGALQNFDIAKRNNEIVHWAFGGPSVSLSFRPEVNGYISVDITDRPWPDDMGGPDSDTMLFGAWSMGHFGPFTFPQGLQRAAQQSWAWPEGKSIPQKHTAFVRILASYVFGNVSGNTPIFPENYDAIGELEFITDVAQAVLKLPGALCYFNPNGETLRTSQSIVESRAFAAERNVPPLDVYCNVRLYNVDEGWLVMDTVGNGQLGLPDLPDLEVCLKKAKKYDLQEIDAFLRNTTLYVWRRGEVFRDGDTIDGPGGVKWRARVRKNGLLSPPRRTIRFFPEDGTEPPVVLFRELETE